MDCGDLLLVTRKGDVPINRYLEFVRLCVENGVNSVQVREKNSDVESLVDFVSRLRNFLNAFRVPIIVNDSVEVALKSGADGVHLGQSDGDVFEARKSLGDDRILGLTVHSMEELMLANDMPLNYLGVGSVFHTNSKKNISHIWGTEGLREAVLASKHSVIAIGGINLTNVSDVCDTGVYGVAAIAAFHDAFDPASTARRFAEVVHGR